MNRTRCQLTIRPEDASGPAHRHECDGDERLEVRDLTTRTTVRVRAAEVSPYRHTLYLEGRAYQVLNISKMH